MTDPVMTELSHPSNLELLELQALEQRHQIRASVVELKSQVNQLRHDLDPAVIARKHFLAASLVAAFGGLISGYGLGGFFSR